MKKIALVTCRVLPEHDTDQEIILEALRKAGFEASMLAWDDPVADPAEHDLCVLRSTWDYYRHPGSFLKWIERADTTGRLMNPGHVVRWNYHKRYLGELASAGLPVVPTVFFERGEEAALGSIMQSRKWDDAVVKPSVSAGSFRTRRFRIGEWEEGEQFLRDLLRDRDAMVQQYMPAVEGDEGEKAIVWIDGEFTHAVRKSPRFAGSGESVSAALGLTDEDREIAGLALERARELVGAKQPLMYGRVDVVRGPEGKLCVSELELIEPSLFLLQHPPALERFVSAVDRFSRETVPVPEGAGATSEPRKPFGRAPEPATFEKFGTWRPDGPRTPEGRPGKSPAGKRPAGKGPAGKGHSGGWKERRGGSQGWKSGTGRPTGWTPKGEEQPPAHLPGVWSPELEKTGGWKPPEGKPPRHGRPPGRSGGAHRPGRFEGESGHPQRKRFEGDSGRPQRKKFEGDSSRPQRKRFEGDAGRPPKKKFGSDAGRPQGRRFEGESGYPERKKFSGEPGRPPRKKFGGTPGAKPGGKFDGGFGGKFGGKREGHRPSGEGGRPSGRPGGGKPGGYGGGKPGGKPSGRKFTGRKPPRRPSR